MKKTTSRKSGFTLVEIMIVVAIIGLLAAIAIPNFINARTTAQTKACVNNLRQIDGAIQQWALEQNQSSGATCAQTDIQKYLGRGQLGTWPQCPAAGQYGSSAGVGTFSVSAPPTCTKASDGHQLPQ